LDDCLEDDLLSAQFQKIIYIQTYPALRDIFIIRELVGYFQFAKVGRILCDNLDFYLDNYANL